VIAEGGAARTARLVYVPHLRAH